MRSPTLSMSLSSASPPSKKNDKIKKTASPPIINKKEAREVDLMSEFSALFYAPWFLQSSFAAEAPTLDIQAIKDMRVFRDLCRDEHQKDQENETKMIKLQASQACLANMYSHLDYLDQSIIVWALAGKMMPDAPKYVNLNSGIMIHSQSPQSVELHQHQVI